MDENSESAVVQRHRLNDDEEGSQRIILVEFGCCSSREYLQFFLLRKCIRVIFSCAIMEVSTKVSV